MLPHTEVAVRNLERIEKVGAAQWLAEQEKQWQCPDCQTTSSWYADTCAGCGRELVDTKDYNG